MKVYKLTTYKLISNEYRVCSEQYYSTYETAEKMAYLQGIDVGDYSIKEIEVQ